MNRKKYLLIVIAIIGLVTAVSVGMALASDNGANQKSKTDKVAEILKFDVAEDMTRFVFDQTKTFDDGLPAHGSSFITEGYIYEYGTLTATNGVLADGSPEFPDKVIGTWLCRGWFVGDAAHATEGVWVVTNQIYSFDDEHGQTIISEGYESAVVDQPFARAITGGTGEYVGVQGEAVQTLLGFNEGTEGVNIRYELALAK